jgi:hypothetical protein
MEDISRMERGIREHTAGEEITCVFMKIAL